MQDLPLTEPKNLKEAIAMTGNAFDQMVNQYAFELFRDSSFRKLAKFDSKSQSEQDRIFNEIVVWYLVLFIAVLESPDLKKSDEEKQFFQMIAQDMPKIHVKQLANLGIPKVFQKQWLKLIDMRYQEYQKDKEQVRSDAVKVHSEDKELTTKDHLDIQLLLPVHTVAICLHHHILKGKVKGEDELFKYLFKAVADKYGDMRMLVEQGEIKKWKKAFAKIMAKWQSWMKG